MSDYGMSVTLAADHQTALARTRAALAEQGFGVLTEIDVAATLKAKLGIEVTPYLIFGACNPPLAHRAIMADPSIGLLLPCNVVVRTLDSERTLVEAMDPRIMIRLTEDDGLAEIAEEATTRLTAALATLESTAQPI